MGLILFSSGISGVCCSRLLFGIIQVLRSGLLGLKRIVVLQPQKTLPVPREFLFKEKQSVPNKFSSSNVDMKSPISDIHLPSGSVQAKNSLSSPYGSPNGYIVTLDLQTGSGGSSSVTATYNAPMPSATMPTRTGYTFGPKSHSSRGYVK